MIALSYTRIGKKNKGYSLIELVVVVAIMAILVGIATMSISTIAGSKVTKCAKNMESLLQQVRISTLGKSEVKVKIYSDGSNNVLADVITTTAGKGQTTETKRLGSGNFTVSYYYTSDESAANTLSNTGFTIQFDRASGALKADGSGQKCKEIKISNSHRTKIIKIYPETGNVELE